MEEYDEEEFERLCAQELEIINEVSQQNLSTEECDFTDIPFNKKEVIEENNTSITSGNENYCETTFLSDDEFRSSSAVKKRLFTDIDSSSDCRIFKRKKSYLPAVGYEIGSNSSVDPDLEMIEHIVSRRKALQVLQQSSSGIHGQRSSLMPKIKKIFAFSEHIPKGDFQAITSESGKRVYLNVLDEGAFEQSLMTTGEAHGKIRLLSVPYLDLRSEAENELLLLNRQILCEQSSTPQHVIGPEDSTENELWASQYKPKHYLDLLSDEATNRTVLQWVKLWDKVVFGRDFKVRIKNKITDKKKNFKFVNKFAPEIIQEFDEIGRPQQKAVLLCGPPGLGKTTLAHIIASHAGYKPIEMNASDDRGVEIFKVNLENATSMKSVFGVDRRPNCLIIDEIDGAPAASINYLVSILQGKPSKNEVVKGKKANKLVLLRPVICICNDLYTPSLRPLRQISLLIHFPPTQPLRLAQRLMFISQKQQMRADLSVLLTLCKKTENDIRSCLSVLQFIRISSQELKLGDLEGVSVGQKDYQRSLFDVWQNIFMLPRLKSEPPSNPHKQPPKLNVLEQEMLPNLVSKPAQIQTSRFSHILKVAQSCGEYDRLTLGWFENYPHVKFKHTYLEPVIAGLEWATMTDILQKEIAHNQNWSLAAYIPLSFVAYHLLFAVNSKPKLQFPTQYHEFISKEAKSKAIIDLMIGGMSAYARIFTSIMSLIQDIIPYLVHIIQPSLRPVNVHLFTSNEKEKLKGLVDTMISYNLTYQQEKTLEGTYFFTLDPNIEDFVQFSSLPKLRVAPYSSKQLVAREVELEKVRRAEAYFTSRHEKPSSKTPLIQKAISKPSDIPQDKIMEVPDKNSSTKPVPNHLQKVESKKPSYVPTNVVAKDFFGRPIVSLESEQQQQCQKSVRNNFLKSDIWFKFQEGYSNAVRRSVKMKDIIRTTSQSRN